MIGKLFHLNMKNYTPANRTWGVVFPSMRTNDILVAGFSEIVRFPQTDTLHRQILKLDPALSNIYYVEVQNFDTRREYIAIAWAPNTFTVSHVGHAFRTPYNVKVFNYNAAALNSGSTVSIPNTGASDIDSESRGLAYIAGSLHGVWYIFGFMHNDWKDIKRTTNFAKIPEMVDLIIKEIGQGDVEDVFIGGDFNVNPWERSSSPNPMVKKLKCYGKYHNAKPEPTTEAGSTYDFWLSKNLNYDNTYASIDNSPIESNLSDHAAITFFMNDL